MDKLTDSEIVKALECCSRTDGYGCEDCPYGAEDKCSINSKRDAIDLINRLQAENERSKPFEEKIAEYNSSIRVENMLVLASSLEEWLEFCDNLKAEAYKEVFEKLKDKSIVCKVKLYGKGKFFPCLSAVTLHDINRLKKELVGEDNASKNKQ